MGNMTIAPLDAVLVALSGIVTVFLMLVVLIAIIHVVSKVVSVTDSKPAPAAASASAAEPAAATEKPQEAQIYGGELRLLGVDEKTAACLMAIVSEETGIPLSQLIFKKIRALDGGAEK